MTVTVLHVSGMTCEHCVAAVRGELARLPTVTDVAVDLATGKVAVTSGDVLDEELVRSAIDDAGYALAP